MLKVGGGTDYFPESTWTGLMTANNQPDYQCRVTLSSLSISGVKILNFFIFFD